MTDKKLKDKVDDLTSELKSAKEQAEEDSGELISRIEILREQAKINTKDLLEGIEEASDTISESIRDALEAEREALAKLREEFKKEKNDKRAFEKSKQFFSQGTAEFRKGNFSKAMDYFQTAQREAVGISSLSLKENGLSVVFNSKFMIAQCLEKFNRGMEALDIYYQLYVNTNEDSDYHKLFVEKTLTSMLNTSAKGIWDSWLEERRGKIRRATNLSIEELKSGAIPYCLPSDWRVVYILSLFDPEFKAYGELFEKVQIMYKERLALLRDTKNKIDESKRKIRILSQQKEDLEKSRKFEENAQPSFRPKNFSGAGMGWLVGCLTFWLGPAALAIMGAPFGPAVIFLAVICIPVGIIAASISKNRKFKRAFEEFKKQKQLNISERMGLISQIEPGIDNWREHKLQLEKWYDNNRILIVEFEK